MVHQRADLVHIPVQDGLACPRTHWVAYQIPVAQPGGEAGLAVGRDGRIWYVDNFGNSGMHAFDSVARAWDAPVGENLNRNYYSLASSKNGTVWAGGGGFLTAIRQDRRGFYSREKLGLPSVPLQFVETGDERWWIIGRIGHVYYLDKSYARWKTYAGLHFETDGEDGTQWFIAEEGRVVSHDRDDGSWTEYETTDGLVMQPQSIVSSSHGLIWVTGKHEGYAAISVFNGNEWQRFLHPEFAQSMGRVASGELADGTLWFGAGGEILAGQPKAGGALQYGVNDSGEPYLLKHYGLPIVPYHVGMVAQTKDETLWIGSPTVYRLEPGAKKAVPVVDLPFTDTFDLVLDAEDTVWVAKLGSGVYRKMDGRWKGMTQSDGLASTHVCDLLPLQDSTLLAASDQGISRFDGASWTGHAFSRDFAMANHSGKMRQAQDGSIWFNFTELDPRTPQVLMNTVNRYCTIRYVAESEPPETEVIEYSEQVAPPGNVHLAWSGRDTFDRTPADRLQFSWRFNGGAWSAFSDETGHTFLKLAEGDYDFEARARDNDFNIDPTPARVSFTVLSPVWKQAWFMGLMLIFSTLVVFLIWMMQRNRERHLFERQAEREKHLVEVDQMKTSFFTNISHELNTPLTLVLGPLERILKREQDESKRTLLNQAMRNVERVSNLASQLMDFRRLEKGKLTVDLAEGDAALIIRETVELLKPLADANKVRCVVRGGGALLGLIDADKLRKIVQNLVGNAIKYTPGGGEVGIEWAEEKGGPHRLLILEVEDTGPGVEEEHLERIFERFYRIPEKRIVDGSGIGLNLTKELVELWGGRILAESPVHENAQNPGSRFTVCLPLNLNGSEKPEIDNV
jgi:signal transduction histidine kinase/streptogramin lyase